MTSSQRATVEVEQETIRIRDLTLTDADAAAFLSERDDEAVTEFVTKALDVGLTAMRLTQTSVDIEYVERKFGEMVSEFSTEIDSATNDFGEQVDEVTTELDDTVGENGRMDTELDRFFGEDGEVARRLEAAFAEDGPLHERLDEEIREDGERIQSALDPRREGSPLKVLKKDIENLRDIINQQQGADSVIQQTTLKGDDFEDTVRSILAQISRHTSDSYDFTGETVGEIPGSQVGDFVYDVGGTNKRIVVEAKTEEYSLNDIENEMEEALENRDADYGIFVTDHLGNVPRTKVGWFHEFNRDYVVVALSENPDSELEPAFLRFAMNWAQIRALHDVGDAADDIDTTFIRSEARVIGEKIDRFAQVREQCTSIEGSVETIREELEDIETEVETRLTNLRAELEGER